MTIWLWVLIALCAAGILLPLLGAVQTLFLAVRLFNRLDRLRESSFVTKLESLQIQLDRLSRNSEALTELKRRAEAAQELIRSSFRELIEPITGTVNATRADFQNLKEELF